VARGILEHAGATLDIAGDGRQAVDCPGRAAAYDMVLMDMQMPVMDGFTATRILRQELGLSCRSLP
jgi:CheY-like chemotaxis protein